MKIVDFFKRLLAPELSSAEKLIKAQAHRCQHSKLAPNNYAAIQVAAICECGKHFTLRTTAMYRGHTTFNDIPVGIWVPASERYCPACLRTITVVHDRCVSQHEVDVNFL